MISIPETYLRARELFQAGQLEQAAKLCLKILRVDANQVDALHLLGVIARRTGRTDLAIDSFSAVLRLQPDSAEAHSNLGNALSQLGNWPEAVASYRQALQI